MLSTLLNYSILARGDYSISFGGKDKSSTQGIGYWYCNVIQKTGIDFEDGNFHVFKYVYSKDDLIILIDNIEVFEWSRECIYKTAFGIPALPMNFMIGAGTKVVAVKNFRMMVDCIKRYANPVNPSPPSQSSHAYIRGNI